MSHGRYWARLTKQVTNSVKVMECFKEEASLPVLQSASLQQEVQTYSLVLSPRIKHPGSHLLEQLRATDQISDVEVAFSV